MQKINFKNLPSTDTAINASNLNLMQDNIESAIEDVEDTIPTIENSLNSDSTTNGASVHVVKERTHEDITTDGSPSKCCYKVDDKDVYVKRISGGYLPNTSSKLIDTGIIDGNLIDIKGQIINGNQTPIPYANPSTGVFGYYTPSTGMIQIMTLSDRSTQLFYIDFYFTYGD